MRIESLRVRNYRVFRDVEIKNLGPLAVFVGANGSGKSTLFDVFGFLRDALQDNVHVALVKRGGFKEVQTRGQSGPIEVTLKFREGPGAPLVTYELAIGFEGGRALVEDEVLSRERRGPGAPHKIIQFRRGSGFGSPSGKVNEQENQTLQSPDILAIKGLGQFQRFATVSAFRNLIEHWHLSDLHVQAARPSQEQGYAEHLTPQGENLALVAQYLHERHPAQFAAIVERMKRRVPGVTDVEATETVDNRLVLRFQDGAFRDPFIARYVSDGTLKMFAYLVLLHDPRPHPLLCVEEPENQLYPTLLHELIEEFREYGERGSQVLISTHSPDLLNGARLAEIYWLEKRDGFTTIHPAGEDELLKNLEGEGDLPGALWKQGLFGRASPSAAAPPPKAAPKAAPVPAKPSAKVASAKPTPSAKAKAAPAPPPPKAAPKATPVPAKPSAKVPSATPTPKAHPKAAPTPSKPSPKARP